MKKSIEKQQNELDHRYNTLIVSPSIEYEAAKICGAEPNKIAMAFYIEKLEKEFNRIKSNWIYRIFNFLKLI